MALSLAACLLATGCSIKRMVISKAGNMLATGGVAYASDDDPELVKAAVPFSLKLIESLLAESPRHKGLLLAASKGFAQYAYAFVQQDADELEAEDLAAAYALRARAKRLYLRAREYGLRGLEVAYPHFERRLRSNPQQTVGATKPADVPLLYWTAVSWAAAISLSKDDPHSVAEVPLMEALIDRALELDEEYDGGAIHSFLITYEMSRQAAAGDPAERARVHFDRAIALTQGRQAGPLVALAEAVCVQKQDLRGFESLLNRALAIDPNAYPEWRLVNMIMQRRARWLLSRRDELFLIPEQSGTE